MGPREKQRVWIFDVLSFRNQCNSQSKHVVDVPIDEGSLPNGACLGVIKTETAIEDVSVFEVKESQSENRGRGWPLRDTGVTRKGR